MKRTLLYICVALATMAGFTSCSSDDELTGSNPLTADNAVIIKASVGKSSAFTRTNPESTNEEEQTKFNPGDKISVSDGSTSIAYTLASDGKTWEPEAGKYLTWHSTPTTFKAFYPLYLYGENTYDVGYVSEVQENKERLAASDFMRVTTVADKETTDHTIDLEFERLTARVVVNIVGYNNQWGDNHPQVDNMYIFGKRATSIREDDPTIHLSQIISYCAEVGKKYIALVCPSETMPNETFLKFQLVGGPSLTVTGIPRMEAGKSYTYNVTLGKDQATIESVTVEDWATGELIPGGEATFKPELNLTGKNISDIFHWLDDNRLQLDGKTITLTGEWNDDFYMPFRSFFDQYASYNISLDLSNVTGMTEVKGDNQGFTNYGRKNSLAGIKLPATVTTIGNKAFEGSKIESITIPSAITSTNTEMLRGMQNLKTVVFEGDVTNIYGNTFYDDTALETIDLSNCKGIPDISALTFEGCNTENITIIVKDSETEMQFRNQPEWAKWHFKAFRVKGTMM